MLWFFTAEPDLIDRFGEMEVNRTDEEEVDAEKVTRVEDGGGDEDEYGELENLAEGERDRRREERDFLEGEAILVTEERESEEEARERGEEVFLFFFFLPC